ncbi:MAG: fatty-acid--CoA ligase [Nitrospinota bacterium]|nr:MAG: fatty-acid--CoA ligase [Nitrospinota bacterium]
MIMDYPLTLQHLLERSRKLYGRKEIVSWMPTGLHRYTYAGFYQRVGRLASVLKRLGVQKGDRVGTLAWNHYRHLELYFAVTCSGAVLHTVNIRLFPEQIAYIINHAGDRILCFDESLTPLLEGIRGELKTVQHYIALGEETTPPATSLHPVHSYEALLAGASPHYDWPHLDEHDAAGMCYTSGTTGHPKGVVYSHRAIFLHSLAETGVDSIGLSEQDTIMIVVPMFHANAWCLPFTATLAGSKQVFPGTHMQPRELAHLIQSERVTVTAGVPTLWIGLQQVLEQESYDLSSLHTILSGGSAVPRSLIETYERRWNIRIIQGWGMTEMTPLGTLSRLKSYMESWPEEERFAVRAKQGTMVAGVELKAVDEEGRDIPWDGKSQGELLVRGPWIASAYYRDPHSAERFHQGWLRTGDVVTIDPEGYIQIVDRTKDLIKSGGEWISSVDLENAIMAHPKVLEAAVIAVPHPKWQERPLACVVPRPEYRGEITGEEILAFLRDKFARWWLPDEVVFLTEIPKTGVGKFDKKVLRQQYERHIRPGSER